MRKPIIQYIIEDIIGWDKGFRRIEDQPTKKNQKYLISDANAVRAHNRAELFLLPFKIIEIICFPLIYFPTQKYNQFANWVNNKINAKLDGASKWKKFPLYVAKGINHLLKFIINIPAETIRTLGSPLKAAQERQEKAIEKWPGKEKYLKHLSKISLFIGIAAFAALAIVAGAYLAPFVGLPLAIAIEVAAGFQLLTSFTSLFTRIGNTLHNYQEKKKADADEARERERLLNNPGNAPGGPAPVAADTPQLNHGADVSPATAATAERRTTAANAGGVGEPTAAPAPSPEVAAGVAAANDAENHMHSAGTASVAAAAAVAEPIDAPVTASAPTPATAKGKEEAGAPAKNDSSNNRQSMHGLH